MYNPEAPFGLELMAERKRRGHVLKYKKFTYSGLGRYPASPSVFNGVATPGVHVNREKT
jgi:hypothetical protein